MLMHSMTYIAGFKVHSTNDQMECLIVLKQLDLIPLSLILYLNNFTQAWSSPVSYFK